MAKHNHKRTMRLKRVIPLEGRCGISRTDRPSVVVQIARTSIVQPGEGRTEERRFAMDRAGRDDRLKNVRSSFCLPGFIEQAGQVLSELNGIAPIRCVQIKIRVREEMKIERRGGRIVDLN